MVVAGVVGGMLAAPAAHADSILFRCYPNLCRVAPDGSSTARVTSDGVRDTGPVYAWLSASTDGARLGVSFGNSAYVLDGSGRKLAGPLPKGGAALITEISPDGRQVATVEQLLELIPPSTLTRLVPYLFLTAADGSMRESVARSTTVTGWLGGRLLRSERADAPPPGQQVCLLATNTDFSCERLVAADAGLDLWDPTASPDGSQIAVTRATAGATSGQIAVYSAASGQLVRVLTSGPSDSQPTWSPDGRRIAFTRGDSGLWVVPANGASGAERRILASGFQPVWVSGGPSASGLRLTAPRRARAGSRARVRLGRAPNGARVRLQRRSGRRWKTLATRRAGTGAVTFTVRLRSPGRVTVRAEVRASGYAPAISRTLAITVRRGR